MFATILQNKEARNDHNVDFKNHEALRKRETSQLALVQMSRDYSEIFKVAF